MLLLLLSLPAAHAVEGMWEPSQLPQLGATLTDLGYRGDAAALARLDAAPLGAVVSTGGCTASFVGAEGLLITNHHCVIDGLQQGQKDGENLVRDGFYAATRGEEISAGPEQGVLITDSVEDVTAAVTGNVPASVDDLGREALLEDRVKKLVARCEAAHPDHRCRVAASYQGLQYTLIAALELRDIRIVMAPPDAVGNYGDEVDNWHWPRHAGDFGFMRAYVGRDGRPADYAVDNVPYRPKQVLRIQPAGVEPGAFVMVAGYPGGTFRWEPALELEREATWSMPRGITNLHWTMEMLQGVIADDPQAEPLLNVTVSELGNSLYNQVGALEGFRQGGVVAASRRRDDALATWVAADPARSARYAPALAELRAVTERRDAWRERDVALAWLEESDLLRVGRELYRLAGERQKRDARRDRGYQARDWPDIRDALVGLQASLQLEAERRYCQHFLELAVALPPDQAVPELVRWVGGTTPAAVAAAVDRLFKDPVLATEAGRLRFLEATPAEIAASPDGFLSLAVALAPYDAARRAEARTDEGAFSRLHPLYAEALKTFDPSRVYPDANDTLRVTVGTVKGYTPQDAVAYLPQTTLEGVVAKAGEPPFDAPPALLAAIASGKPGPYLDKSLGSVPVDFLTDLDTTGGNSGSPTLNAQGELVGLLFDGNYESIASDWTFNPALTRSIHVDIRYILYYLDAVVHARPLLGELGVAPAF